MAKTSATEGAHSVYRFIERTAERVPEGVRWETIDYGNQPHYSYGAFDGFPVTPACRLVHQRSTAPRARVLAGQAGPLLT